MSLVRTIIQLDEEQHRELLRIARERKTSMAALIREGVDKVLQNSVTLGEKKRRALEAVGRHRSGIPDLASKHDEYLAEGYGEKTR